MASGSSGSSRTRVGRYELGRTLGEGTFAKVKFARNIETGENVAIKILDKEKILKHKMIAQIFKAEFTCPPWFSSSAKKLVKRILDPNPMTRITIAEVIENEWFKKGYKPSVFENEDVSLDDVDAIFNESGDTQNLVVERREERPANPVSMNAFELISKSQGLNLSSLFEKQMGLVKRETRFTSKCPANEIISKIEEAAAPLGFDVKKNNYKLKLQGEKTGRKGHLSVATEIYEVAPSLCMVELRKARGDTLEFHKFYKNLATGLKDIVWKSGDETKEEANDGVRIVSS